MKNLFLLSLILILAFTVSGQKERDQIQDQYKWDLSHLYPNDKSWEEAKNILVAKMAGIEQFKGKLTKSSANLLACLEFSTTLDKEVSKLFL